MRTSADGEQLQVTAHHPDTLHKRRRQHQPNFATRHPPHGVPDGRPFLYLHFGHQAMLNFFFFFNHPSTPEIYTLSLHDALPICRNRPQSFAGVLRVSRITEGSIGHRPVVQCRPGLRRQTLRYWSRSRRSRSITSSGLSAASRIIARTASPSDTRGTSTVTAAESAHAVPFRHSSVLMSRVILTGADLY